MQSALCLIKQCICVGFSNYKTVAYFDQCYQNFVNNTCSSGLGKYPFKPTPAFKSKENQICQHVIFRILSDTVWLRDLIWTYVKVDCFFFFFFWIFFICFFLVWHFRFVSFPNRCQVLKEEFTSLRVISSLLFFIVNPNRVGFVAQRSKEEVRKNF